jgi:glycerophosphoryl diester phosphodiesterase
MRPFPLASTTIAAVTLALLLPLSPAQAAPRAPGPEPTAATLAAAGRSRSVTTPTLTARATLSADFLAPGPESGAKATPANGRQGPFDGQVIPGFSGVVANGDGTYWAMPDNGFGTKANSADFLLRLYLVRPAWETANGGRGKITIIRFVSLRDPDRKISFPLVNGGTRARLLTGADFDIESVVRAADGTFWIGEEFGPFLLHVDRRGRVLSAPVPFPGGKSPENPTLGAGEEPVVPSSRGFEALAGSRNGRWLYPIVEGALVGDPDPRRRQINQFDIRRNRYTARTWNYQTDEAANVIGDAHMINSHQLLVLERDNFDGPAAVIKRVYKVDLNRRDADGFVPKTLVIDLLDIDNPAEIGVERSPGAYGVGRSFSFPFQSVETIVPLGRDRYLLANDNNFPGNAARYPGRPDDTEMIMLDLRKKRVRVPDAGLIAHRGASGYRPEHTLAAYELAIQQGADYIEPDVVATRDGVLVARHENNIADTTDVSTRTDFADRRTTKTIDGVEITGWFTEDFTLAELKTLRAIERLPLVRGANTAFNGLYQVPTLDEVVDLARHSRTATGRRVGVYPETKHPTYFASIGLALEEPLLDVLEGNGYGDADDPVFIQSFETTNLQWLSRHTDLALVQLIDCKGAPYDLRAAGDERRYADLVTPDGLAEISGYADVLGLCKDVMIPRDALGNLLAPTPVIRLAHAVGLQVSGWTFRRENQFLPLQFRSSAVDSEVGDLRGEISRFLAAGMDTFFTDNPDVGDLARRSPLVPAAAARPAAAAQAAAAQPAPAAQAAQPVVVGAGR